MWRHPMSSSPLFFRISGSPWSTKIQGEKLITEKVESMTNLIQPELEKKHEFLKGPVVDPEFMVCEIILLYKGKKTGPLWAKSSGFGFQLTWKITACHCKSTVVLQTTLLLQTVGLPKMHSRFTGINGARLEDSNLKLIMLRSRLWSFNQVYICVYIYIYVCIYIYICN